MKFDINFFLFELIFTITNCDFCRSDLDLETYDNETYEAPKYISSF